MDLDRPGPPCTGDDAARADADQLATARRRRTMKHSSALTAHTSPCRASYSALPRDAAEDDATPTPTPTACSSREVASVRRVRPPPAKSFDGACPAVKGPARCGLVHQSSCAHDETQARRTACKEPSCDSEQLPLALLRSEWPCDIPSITTSQTDDTEDQPQRKTETEACNVKWKTDARLALPSVADTLSQHTEPCNAVLLRDVAVMTDLADRRSASVARLLDDNPLGNIGLEVMKLYGAVPGFRQLQKVSSLSAQSSESLEKAPVKFKANNSNRTLETNANYPTAPNTATVANSSPVLKPMCISKQQSASDSQTELVACNGPQPVAISIDATSATDDVKIVRELPNDAQPVHNAAPIDTAAELELELELEQEQPSRIGIGFRLGRRRALYEKRRKMADYSLLVAAFGILLTIVETELTMADVYNKQSVYSLCMKLAISLSTVVLLVLVCAYHAIEVQLFSIDNGIEDWRVAINSRRILRLIVELSVCAVHPFPMTGTFLWVVQLITTNATSECNVPVDAILALPMFLRLYLIFRVMLLHSKLFTDASSRSIGALNRIKFNIRFVLKTMMTICPGTVLLVLILSLLIVSSWTIRLCERYHESKYQSILNALWFASITFLSIGYGDVVPSTACGRLIAIITGVIGSGCTALVIAVVATKLELSRAEQHVHNFMLDTQLTKQLKNAAANVLRETWFIYKYTKLTKRINAAKVRMHQRLFLEAIQALRRVKLDQRKLTENSMRLADLPKLHHQLHDVMTDTRQEQLALRDHVRQLEDKMSTFEKQIGEIPRKVVEQFLPHLQRLMQAQSSTPNLSRPIAANRAALLRQSTVHNDHHVHTATSLSCSPARKAGPQASESPCVRRQAVLANAQASSLAARKPRIEAVTQTTFASSTGTQPSMSRLESHEANLADADDRRTVDTLTVENPTMRQSDVSLRRLAQADMCNSTVFRSVAVPVLASSENSSLSVCAAATNEDALLRVGSKASVSTTTHLREKIAECPSQFRSFSHA